MHGTYPQGISNSHIRSYYASKGEHVHLREPFHICLIVERRYSITFIHTQSFCDTCLTPSEWEAIGSNGRAKWRRTAQARGMAINSREHALQAGEPACERIIIAYVAICSLCDCLHEYKSQYSHPWEYIAYAKWYQGTTCAHCLQQCKHNHPCATWILCLQYFNLLNISNNTQMGLIFAKHLNFKNASRK